MFCFRDLCRSCKIIIFKIDDVCILVGPSGLQTSSGNLSVKSTTSTTFTTSPPVNAYVNSGTNLEERMKQDGHHEATAQR